MKQAVLQNGSFYIIQSVQDESLSFALGSLVPKKLLPRKRDEQRFKQKDDAVEFVDFFCEESVKGLEPSFISREDLLNTLENVTDLKPTKFNFKPSFFEDYESRFDSFMNTEELKKAVLYKSYTSNTGFPDQNSYLHTLKALLEKTKVLSGYLYGFYDRENKRAVLGFSPELLYQKFEDKFLIHAVAGTQKKSEFKPWSEKLIAEHKLVEEGIHKRLSPKQVNFDEASSADYGHLSHLKSIGQIREDVSEDDLLKLHPTSAVGTLPYEYHTSFDAGPSPRGFFGGYVKLKTQTKSFAVVLIRGVEFRENFTQLCIGGGVLKNSDLNEEWSELEAKWDQFKQLWGLES